MVVANRAALARLRCESRRLVPADRVYLGSIENLLSRGVLASDFHYR